MGWALLADNGAPCTPGGTSPQQGTLTLLCTQTLLQPHQGVSEKLFNSLSPFQFRAVFPVVSFIFWSSSLQVGSRSWLTGLGHSLSARVWWKCSGWWKRIGSFSQKDPVCKFKITARPTSTKALTHVQVLERLSSPLLGPFYPTLLSVLTDNINIDRSEIKI